MLVDSNDFAMGGFTHLLKDYKVVPLEAGDFVFETTPKLIFERKTIGDFMQSLPTHHIHTQLTKMQAITPYNYIVIVGNINKFFIESEFYDKKQFIGGLASLSLHGAKFLFVDNNEQLFDLMYSMNAKFPERNEPILFEQDMSFKKREVSNITKVLMCIEGIGVEKAELIADSYGSLSSIQLAIDENQFMCQGIGPKTIEKIKSFLGEIL
jgi:ERCC4-type nuclease